MGLAFAFGWTPCIGPILSPILGLASIRDTVGEGALLLGVYSLGLGIPFMLSAMFVGQFMVFMLRFRKYMPMVEKATGVLLVAAGIWFITGGPARLSYQLLEAFPQLQKLG